MLFRKPIVLAALINAFFLALYLAFGVLQHGSLDDYFMSCVLTGAYGSEYDVHMYFVNSAYGYFLKPFYLLFPKVGWYFLFELAGTFAAFLTFAYFLIRRLGTKKGVVLSFLLLATFTPDFYFQLSFTQCATIYTAAGLVSISFASEKRRFWVMGCFFLIAGSVMRWEGFLLGMPYLLLFASLYFVFYRSKRKEAVIALGICLAAICGLHAYDKSLYTGDDYKLYTEYQPVRAFFGDGAFYDIESTFDELQERGMQGADFRLLKSWMFYDKDVFSIDRLRPIIDVANNNLYSPNPARMPVAFFMAVSRELTRSIGWCWAIFCILLMLIPSKRANIYPWISLGIISVSIGYLLLVNRLAYHVESGIWLYAVVCSIPFLSNKEFNSNSVATRLRNIVPYILMLLAVFFAYFGIAEQGNVKKQWRLIEGTETPSDWKSFLEYTEMHLDDVFLLSFERYKTLGTYKNPAYLAVEPGSWQNIFSWGYWNIYLPGMEREFHKRGIQNPIKDIIHDNVYLLEDDNRPSLLDFYRTHYHDSLWVDTVKTFGDLMLLKYHSSKLQENDGGIL